MKRSFLKLIIFLAFVSFLSSVKADSDSGIIKIDNPLQFDNFWDLLSNILNFLFYASLPIGALIIAISAYYLLFSGGEPEKVKTAKNMIIWTLVGIVVIFLAMPIIALLKEILGVNG